MMHNKKKKIISRLKTEKVVNIPSNSYSSEMFRLNMTSAACASLIIIKTKQGKFLFQFKCSFFSLELQKYSNNRSCFGHRHATYTIRQNHSDNKICPWWKRECYYKSFWIQLFKNFLTEKGSSTRLVREDSVFQKHNTVFHYRKRKSHFLLVIGDHNVPLKRAIFIPTGLGSMS